MSIIVYLVGKAFWVLCWKSSNLNNFDIKWSENFNIKLKLYLYSGALQKWPYTAQRTVVPSVSS